MLVAVNIFLIIALGYLFGSIPTAIIMGKALRGIDIREHGSGNAGGTNVFRVLGWKPGVAVILIDMLKGAIATIFVPRLVLSALPIEPIYLSLLAGFAAIAGHIWTIFAHFRGGKGVGTAAGMLFGLVPIAATICLAIFFIIAFATRYVSLASMTAAVALPVVNGILEFAFNQPQPAALHILSIILALLIVFTHRSNIKRLLNGTENRFGQKQTG